VLVLAAIVCVLPLAATAQDAASEEIQRELEQRALEGQAEALAAEREARFDKARARLEEAAREIAALSGEVAGQFASEVMEQVRMETRRAYLGINVASADDPEGVLIEGVTPGGPAAEAGLRPGDVIRSIDGEDLVNTPNSTPVEKLVAHLRGVETGDAVELGIAREGREMEIPVETGTLDLPVFSFSFDDEDVEFDPGHFASRAHNAFIGRWGDLELVDLTPELGEYFGSEEGLLVVRKPRDASLTLMEGDVILGIGGRRPTSPEHAMRILRSYEPGEALEMEIIRKGRRQNLTVDLPTASDRAARFHPAGPLPGEALPENRHRATLRRHRDEPGQHTF
jgi:C-terminal processing protease CtpA/Prc